MTKPTPPNPWAPWLGHPKEPFLLSGIGCVMRGETGLDPRVQLRFTAFRDPELWNDETAPLRDRLDGNRMWWGEIPAGQYPATHVGQVWTGGHLQRTPRYSVEVFDIAILPETCRVDRDSQCIGRRDPADRIFRVSPPAPEGTAWRGIAGTDVLVVDVPGQNGKLLIPCAEVVRRYYGPSTEMMRALCTGYYRSQHVYQRIDEEGQPHFLELYNLKKSQVDDEGVSRVHLRAHVKNEDRLPVGRFRYSALARRRALFTARRLQSRWAERVPATFRALPPFEGRTQMKVHGVWLGAEAGMPASDFLVFWIAECTGAFPFERLGGSRDNANRPQENRPGGGGAGDGGRRPGSPYPRMSKGEVAAPARPAGSLLRGLVKGVVPGIRYRPSSTLVLVQTPPPPPEGDVSWPVPIPGVQGDVVSSDPATSGESPRDRLSVVSAEGDPARGKVLLPHLLEFQAMLERLADAAGWELSWRNPVAELGGEGGIGAPFPVKDPQTRSPRWCYVDTKRRPEDGGLKRRHLLIADVVLGKRHAYLLEIERRPSEEFATLMIAAAGGVEVTTEWFVRFLKLCVRRAKRRVGPWPLEAADLEVYTKIPHAGSSDVPVVGESYRRRIEAALRTVLDPDAD